MGTKTISIMDDVYELLVRNKNKDESFSEVIRKEFSKKGKISESAGILSDLTEKQFEEMEIAIRKAREYTRKHIMERLR